MHRRFLLPALGVLLIGVPGWSRADGPAPPKNTEAKLPTPAEVKELVAQPKQVSLVGADASAQVILTGMLQAGGVQDLTAAVEYEVADAKVVRVSSSGRFIPLANGMTTVTARYGDRSAAITVKAE